MSDGNTSNLRIQSPVNNTPGFSTTPSEKAEQLLKGNLEGIQASLTIEKKSNESLAQAIRQMQSLWASKDLIDAPTIDPMNAYEIMVNMININYSIDINAQQMQLTSLDKQGKKINDEKMVNLKNYIKNQMDSVNAENQKLKAGNTSFGFGIFAFVIGVASVALSILTGGAAVALIAGVVGAILSAGNFASEVANKVFETTNATEKDLFGNTRSKNGSIGHLMVLIHEAVVKATNPGIANSTDPEVRKKFSDEMQNLELGVNISMMVVNMAVSVFGMAASLFPKLAAKISEASIKGFTLVSETTANLTKTIVDSIEFAGQVAGAASDISGSIIGFQLADASFNMKQADNKLNYLEAVDQQIKFLQDMAMKKLNQRSDDFQSDQESLSDLAKSIYQYQSMQVNTI
jgi:hypothetical protein